MELTDNDKERIEQFAKAHGESFKTGEWFENLRIESCKVGAEYATIYEREQQVKEIERMKSLIVKFDKETDQKDKRIEELEAERSELLEKMTELLKAFNDSDKNYADWVATKELYSAFTGVNNLLERLTK